MIKARNSGQCRLLSCPGQACGTVGTKGGMAVTKVRQVVHGLMGPHHLSLYPPALAVFQQHRQEALDLLTGHSHGRSLKSYPGVRLRQRRGVHPVAIRKNLAVETWRILAAQGRPDEVQDLHLLDRGLHREQSCNIDGREHRLQITFRVAALLLEPRERTGRTLRPAGEQVAQKSANLWPRKDGA